MSNDKVILEGCIKQFKEFNEIDLPESEIFELFSLSQIHKDRNITFENIQGTIVDGGNDGGVDSIMVFINEDIVETIDEVENIEFSNKTVSRFIVSQCKKENSFKESALDKLLATIPILFDLEKNEIALISRFNSDVVSQALLLRDVWQKTAINGGEIYIELIYTCNAPEVEFNSVFSNKVDQLRALIADIFSTSNIEFTNYSSKELLLLYQKQRSNRLTIEFKDRPLSTEYENNGIGYIGTVNLSDYKNFLTSDSDEIRDDLFESNIRHYQGSVDVNKKIQATVSEVKNEDFWWLNNGITIIAEDPKEVGKKLSIENIQIVNGLQTSYSIYNNHVSNDSDNRSVLVKVIINDNKDTVDNIIASTNSQSPVSATLLRANEFIQRKLEMFFINEGYYYDRRKNYYKNQGKPSSKIFSMQNLAQSIESIIFNDPDTARARPMSLFKNENTYNKIFNPNMDFTGYLNCCLINRKVHNFWLKHSDPVMKAKSSNYKYHLSCIAVKFLNNKGNVAFDEIVSADLDGIDEALFSKTIDFLSSQIDSYLNENDDANLISIAKSKNFTTYILNNLEVQFGQ